MSLASECLREIAPAKVTVSQAEEIAFARCKLRLDREFGWGPCTVYVMDDGSELHYDGRGWTVGEVAS